MAFGDLVKNATAYDLDVGTIATPDLGSNPTSGNLLIATFGSNRINRTITTAPSGFTVLHEVVSTTAGHWVWYYKVSDGTEQTTSLTWSGNISGVAEYLEFEWDGSTPTVTKNDDQTNISTAVTTQASGAATPTSSTNICIACHGTESSTASDFGQSVDGSWIEDTIFAVYTGGHLKTSRLVNAALSSQEATNTSTLSEEMYGAIAVFDSGAGGSATGKSNPLTGCLGGPLSGVIT